jgi:hypothetical protein
MPRKWTPALGPPPHLLMPSMAGLDTQGPGDSSKHTPARAAHAASKVGLPTDEMDFARLPPAPALSPPPPPPRTTPSLSRRIAGADQEGPGDSSKHTAARAAGAASKVGRPVDGTQFTRPPPEPEPVRPPPPPPLQLPPPPSQRGDSRRPERQIARWDASASASTSASPPPQRGTYRKQPPAEPHSPPPPPRRRQSASSSPGPSSPTSTALASVERQKARDNRKARARASRKPTSMLSGALRFLAGKSEGKR